MASLLLSKNKSSSTQYYVNKIKSHPIVTTCGMLTVTSGALLATWVIRNINKAVADQTKNMMHDKDMSPLPSPRSKIEEKKDEDIDDINIIMHDGNETLSGDKIQVKIPKYNGPNPFILKPLSNYEKFKIYFFCMNGIVHIKLTSMLLILSSMYILSIPPKNIICTSIQRLLLRLALFNFGFYWIPGKFTNRTPGEPYRVIVANHNTIFDGLVLLTVSNGCIAAKKELSKIPIVGRIMNNGLSILWIDRNGPKGRENAKQQILDQVCIKTTVVCMFGKIRKNKKFLTFFVL